MSYEYNQISKPVTIDDLQQAVGSGSTDLATIIEDGSSFFAGTPRWNLHKPTKGSSKLFALTDAELYALDCGLNVPVNRVTSIAIGVTEDASCGGGAYFEGEAGTKICDVAVEWAYKGVPTGGASDPYRISDFISPVNNTTGFLTTPAVPIQITVETVKGNYNYTDSSDEDRRPRIVYTVTGNGFLMELNKLYSLLYAAGFGVDAGFIIIRTDGTIYGINGNTFMFPLSNIPEQGNWEFARPYNRTNDYGHTYYETLCIGLSVDASQGTPGYIVPLDGDFFVTGSQAYTSIIVSQRESSDDQIDVDCYGFVHYNTNDQCRYIYFKGEVISRGVPSISGATFYARLEYSERQGGTKSTELVTSTVSLPTLTQNVTNYVYPTGKVSGVERATAPVSVTVTNPVTGEDEDFMRIADPITPSQTDDTLPCYHFISLYVLDRGSTWYKQQVAIMTYNEFWGISS